MELCLIILKILVALNDFIERCNLIPHLGNPDLPVYLHIVGGEEDNFCLIFNLNRL